MRVNLEDWFKGVDHKFAEIFKKPLRGEEIGVDEAERLMKATGSELSGLLITADRIRERSVGDVVTYVVNRNINFTNVCISDCKFCAFHRRYGAPDSYLLTPEEVRIKTQEAVRRGATEICMQGGLHPNLKLKDYLSFLRAIRDVSSKIHIHAFSPAEIDHISKQEDIEIVEVIKALRENGLDSVPGTAAEILVPRVRSIICSEKIGTDEWETIIKTCHRLGIRTTATMMYGHVETAKERAEHLAIVREIQRETGGFTEFVPLGFMHRNTALHDMQGSVKREEIDDLRVHATARLMLAGYIENIQASWVKLGPRLAQRVIRAGANDLSGTLMEENISREAGGKISQMFPEQLEGLIRDAGRVPRQRTTMYELL